MIVDRSRIPVALVLAGLWPAAAVAQTPPAAAVRLTLDEARQRALANKQMALAHLNLQEKEHATAAAAKDYYPKLLGSVTYFHFDRPLGTVLTAGGGPLGLVQPTTVPVSVVNQDASLSTLLVAQPITKLIAVSALVQIARADEAIARAKLDKGTTDLLSGVAQLYYGLSGIRRIRASLELQAQALEQLVAARPVAELRVSLLEVRQGLLLVRGQEQDLAGQLNNLLDLPACTVIEFVDPPPPVLAVACADAAASLAVSCSAEVREAEQTIAKAEAGLRVARMAYLPDVNIVGGYGNQTSADYIQDNFGYVGVTASYTFFEWGKRQDVKRQRQTQIALAHQNLQVTRDKVALEARKSYGTYEQALEAYRLAEEMAKARKDAEQGATDPTAVMAAKAATAKADLEVLKAEVAYRVAHAQLAGVTCSAH